MRISKETAAANHCKIVEAAVELFCEQGFEVALVDLMRAAGFTQGGFYNHFRSKEALITEAVRTSMRESLLMLQKQLHSIARKDKAKSENSVANHLMMNDRKATSIGYLLASLGASVGRQSKKVQSEFAESLEKCITMLATSYGREEAVQMLCLTTGSIVLAQAVAKSHPAMTKELLHLNRRSLRRIRRRRDPKRP